MRYPVLVAATLTLIGGAAPLQAAVSALPADLMPLALRQLTAEVQAWRAPGALVGKGGRRRLGNARRQLAVQSAFSGGSTLEPDHRHLRDSARSCYLDLYRATFKRELSLDLPFARRSARQPWQAAPAGSSWRLRIEPGLTLGSHGSLGTRLSLPDTGNALVGRLSFEVRRGYADDEVGMALRYRDGEHRFLQLEHITGDSLAGERLSATVALRF
jgi:hypothetical protein